MAIPLRYEKSSRSRSLVYLVFGFSFGLVALIMILKTPIDAYRESQQAKWPSVVATITQQVVRKYSGRQDVWRIESEVRYSVDGEVLASSIHSGVGSSGEERDMYGWTSQHPPGTSLPIRYDPRHHNTVVLDAGDMPESGSEVPGDMLMLLSFSVLSITLITIGRVLQRRQPKPV
jgi:Protein of unknown function (DUF3592)